MTGDGVDFVFTVQWKLIIINSNNNSEIEYMKSAQSVL